ncbi:CTP synthase [Agromyces rhizosphaerae]|uniref:CTP synthase n=1 Tax=Agromyces rhizosphaerae TaxID=88374 RepID=A0A9W6CVX4_9MICO|nr:hypothetical protein [Agromyces rhizosphaerae]GLI26675.1 CTP synthase [Agromyces rhizosphaerae]
MDDGMIGARARLGDPERLSTAQLLGAGATHRQVRQAVREGSLIRVRRGAFAPRAAWAAASPEERHVELIRATATAQTRHDRPVSHLSAAAVHGLPIIGRMPDAVELWDGAAGGGSSTPGIRTHRGGARPATVEIEGITVTSLPRTAVDIASTEPFATAVCVLDAAMGRTIPDADGNGEAELTAQVLLAELSRAGIRRGRRAATRAIGFADSRSGSPGESWSRASMHELGFEVPELQVRFERQHGHADVDYFWRSRGIVGEFDGAQKYMREEYLRGRTPAEVVVAEKRREDELRRHPGVRGFVRWDWRVARSPRRLAELLDAHGVPRR